jgi:PAS domain S-box-containing protein
MKNSVTILMLVLVVAVGATVMARLDWLHERRSYAEQTTRTGERLVQLLALYPIQKDDGAIRSLLSKSLVEHSAGEGVAYLIVNDVEGKPLVAVGDLASLVPAEVTMGAVAAAGPLRQRFAAPNGPGEILEFAKPLIQSGGQAGTVRLGLRSVKPPFLSPTRLSSVAAVAFLMLAAIIVGYYLVLLAVRRLSNAPAAGPAHGTAGAPAGESVLRALQHLDDNLTAAREELHKATEHNADLSSQLGISLFERQQVYRVLDGLDFGILILDAQGRVRHANRHMLELLGVRREALLGKRCAEAVAHGALVDLVEEATEGSQGDTAAGVEAEFGKNAPGRFFRLMRRPVLDATGDRIGTMVVAEDITRAKIAERAQNDFIGQVAHELFTPLTSMKTHAEMLISGDIKDVEMQKEFYNTINDEADRLTALIKNLLSVAKMEAGTLTIERALVKTDWLLDQCLNAVEATARDKHIAITKTLPDKFPVLLGDKALLQVVLVNLLGNAVKYTPRGGAVRLTLLERERNVFFEIADTGCGISADDLPHIFDKFYRGSSSAVRNESGSGMGLATAQQIVKLHGGTIEVESEPGKGSCFTVRIPTETYTLEKR